MSHFTVSGKNWDSSTILARMALAVSSALPSGASVTEMPAAGPPLSRVVNL